MGTCLLVHAGCSDHRPPNYNRLALISHSYQLPKEFHHSPTPRGNLHWPIILLIPVCLLDVEEAWSSQRETTWLQGDYLNSTQIIPKVSIEPASLPQQLYSVGECLRP